MTSSLMQAAVHVNETTVAFYLEVPRSHVVLLQVYFELYDGVGTVRTLEGEPVTVCVLTTPSQVTACVGVLNAVREHVSWVPCETIPNDPLV